MRFKKLLIANRGEIAIRIARAAGETGLATVAIYPADDSLSLHVRAADAARDIPGRGARAYLDIEAVIAAAKATGCDALHPGYGFLSENSLLARRCAQDGITFVGPSPAALDLFGDKAKAKALAKDTGVPIIEAAKQLAAAANYDNLGTFEFLVDGDASGEAQAFAFIEANPRLQVEHTVTEEVLGVDLVQAQL